MNMLTKLLFFLIFICFLFSSCHIPEKMYFHLHNNESIEINTIEDISIRHKIHFSQYEGFFIKQKSILLDTLFIITNDYDEIFNSILSQEEIKAAYNLHVESLKSKKIDKSKYDLHAICEILKKEYSQIDQITLNEENNIQEIYNASGEKFIQIEYVELGIPGFFITLLPQNN